MSVVLIKQHNENIYQATKKCTTYHKKEKRYISKHRDSIKLEYRKVKRYPHATMGLPEKQYPTPSEFLKKGSGIRHKVKLDFPVTSQSKRLEPVIPTTKLLEADRQRRNQLPPEKNFVRVNVDAAVNLTPKVPEKRIAINRNGDLKNMSAGMEPIYIFKDKFGKMPKYLTRFIKQKEKNMLTKKDATGIEQPKCRYITREQREQLLKGLKENWEDLQKTYQGLPILTDTIPKMQRKTKLEEDLKLLEKDIVLLERHPYIYVFDDMDLSND